MFHAILTKTAQPEKVFLKEEGPKEAQEIKQQSANRFTFAGGESGHLLSDSRIETSSQTERKQACGLSVVDQKKTLV